VKVLKIELESVASVLNLNINPVVFGNGTDENPWIYSVTFREPLGPLPLLHSDKAIVKQITQGKSTLQGSLVLAYNDEYSRDILFDASAEEVKASLEFLPTIEEVNVQKIDKRTGYEWVISFTKSIGNLPNIVAYSNIFEVQKIVLAGGDPTPLGGYFKLSYALDETSLLSYDTSADDLRYTLETLPAIYRVDVSRTAKSNSQFEWYVTFRYPECPISLVVNRSMLTRTVDDMSVSVEVPCDTESLYSTSGALPQVFVKEKVAGLPSYSASYMATKAGNYSLAVLQLQPGGLAAWYYDNQWFLEEPVIERVDPIINFNWSLGSITPFGRDYVSVRWWGKVKPKTSEPYTFFVTADDGVKVYLDHTLIIDSWHNERGNEKRATVNLTAHRYHDIKIKYKEEVGLAYMRLYWTSKSIQKTLIPQDQLYYPTHISRSSFSTEVLPGAADYPHSDILQSNNNNNNVTIAGELTFFIVQAKDALGNKKISMETLREINTLQGSNFLLR